jgi:glycosyltransferase 2 family protein
MKNKLDYIWPIIGLIAVVASGFLLFDELKGLSAADIWGSLRDIPLTNWALCIGSTIVAYGALAWYDRIALLHLGHKLGWMFISLVSFTTYALSHNIGASVFSGAMVRYRAYSTKGLSAAEVGVLVAFCSFTFALGTLFLLGLVLVGEPDIIERLKGISPYLDFSPLIARIIGFGLLGFVALYLLGAISGFKPLVLRGFRLEYPRKSIALRQIFIAPIELLGAAGIIYFALPDAGNPGYFIVLGVFLASFSAALLSHAPGGLGVLEFVFVAAMPEMNKADVIAALIVFRLLYLIIPLIFSLIVVVIFEQSRLADVLRK